ncbi:MAG TPA: hypothetical protein PLU95_01260 [Syntrophales bacterium]|nr:hypothetical protein [Syntrophorhabdus sp.]HPL67844.1 hypothetical protein [Smithellaceae bacterium]HPN07904.1 hypothetical protein [Syntrophales bacterium]
MKRSEGIIEISSLNVKGKMMINEISGKLSLLIRNQQVASSILAIGSSEIKGLTKDHG